jgi:mono/diheme cytochrome c family protein
MTFPARRCGVRAWTVPLALALALPPNGGVAADSAHGEQLAKRWCASCHIVGPDQTHGADNVPTLASIARRPGFSADKVAKFLMDPHPRMPDMQLGRAEAADLGAYIATLAK